MGLRTRKQPNQLAVRCVRTNEPSHGSVSQVGQNLSTETEVGVAQKIGPILDGLKGEAKRKPTTSRSPYFEEPNVPASLGISAMPPLTWNLTFRGPGRGSMLVDRVKCPSRGCSRSSSQLEASSEETRRVPATPLRELFPRRLRNPQDSRSHGR